MKDDSVPDIIDEALVCDGYEFTNHNARGRYIHADLIKRPQWLKDNPSKWRSVREIREKAAERKPSPDTIVKGGPYSSSSRSNVSGSKSDGGKSAAELPADDASLRDLSPPVTVSPTRGVPSPPAIVGNALTINGRTYITTEQFALMLDVSLRTLHRSFAGHKGPPKIKITGVFYKIEDALRWAADRGRPIKRTAFIKDDDKA